MNDLRVKIYALECKRRGKFSNQLVNVRAFHSHACFLSGRGDEEEVKQTKKSFTYHHRGFRNNLRCWCKIFGKIGAGWNLSKEREIGYTRLSVKKKEN